MRDYSWAKEYANVVCETDDKLLLNKIERLIGDLTQRFANLSKLSDVEERGRVATAIASLLVLKSERVHLGKILRPPESAELN